MGFDLEVDSLLHDVVPRVNARVAAVQARLTQLQGVVKLARLEPPKNNTVRYRTDWEHLDSSRLPHQYYVNN